MVEDGDLPDFDFIEINGMRLTEPTQAYVQIWYFHASPLTASIHSYYCSSLVRPFSENSDRYKKLLDVFSISVHLKLSSTHVAQLSNLAEKISSVAPSQGTRSSTLLRDGLKSRAPSGIRTHYDGLHSISVPLPLILHQKGIGDKVQVERDKVLHCSWL